MLSSLSSLHTSLTSASLFSFSPSLALSLHYRTPILSPQNYPPDLSPRHSPSILPPCHAMATGGSTWDMEEWRKKLPEKKVPLYSHSLPCIEAWLNSLGFFQSRDDRAVWLIQRPDWHAQLSLDITELYIRYLKSGPGNLDRDIERKFSYALSREDVENAILGGP
ncbi:unnamed protein product [Sphagnum troendelagicum]|uniref:Uncharacterized protein n=3 Tax=Sphagnum TaxID=13804 RepID=A0ABP0U608_9BRYO